MLDSLMDRFLRITTTAIYLIIYIDLVIVSVVVVVVAVVRIP